MLGKSRSTWFAALAFLVLSSAAFAAEELKLDHVVVSYGGISKEYAQAIGRTAATARDIAIGQFGFDMPEVIHVEIVVDPDKPVRLYNDGQDHIFLTIRSEENLHKPSVTGIYNIYGMCHEVGHMTMYRLIRDHSWLKSEAAEGWAHYIGSRLVDGVYAKEGGDLWPDRYDYIEDGTKRLEKHLSSATPMSMVKVAGAWKQLANIVGDKGIAPIFRAWDKVNFDPANPAEGLGEALSENASEQTQQWWSDAQDLLVIKRAESNVKSDTIEEDKLSGKTRELAHDDGKQSGKRSIAGGGHAVRFKAPNDSCYVTEVRIYGSRYGLPSPPKENFHVWLCDKDFKVISDNQFPYAKFQRGNPRWVALKIKPTRISEEFIVCAGFNPTATKGVFVHYDAEGSGNSLVGLPGEQGNDFAEGDWMIRVGVRDKGESD